MKLIGSILVLLLMLNCQASAISSVNPDMIKEAQEYGKSKVEMDYAEFIKPWMAYEEKVPKLDEMAERAHVYTPFLLIAADARDKTINSQSITLKDSSKVVDDYKGYVIFGVTLFDENEASVKSAAATVRQDGEAVKAYQTTVSKTSMASSETHSFIQCYFYFNEKDIIPNKPLFLDVSIKDRPERHFYFDIAKIK